MTQTAIIIILVILVLYMLYRRIMRSSPARTIPADRRSQNAGVYVSDGQDGEYIPHFARSHFPQPKSSLGGDYSQAMKLPWRDPGTMTVTDRLRHTAREWGKRPDGKTIEGEWREE